MNSTYFRQADAAIFVYDVTREESLDSVMYWDDELTEKVGEEKRVEKIVTALVANKIDLED
jgi:Rab family protein